MRVLAAFDGFKGSLGAREAGEAAAAGIRRVVPDAQVRVVPLADGGEGTAEVLADVFGGEWRTAEVTHPLGRSRVHASWLKVTAPPAGGPDAVVETARGSGLVLVPPADRDPLVTTTRGTGELVARAVDEGARRIWLTLGGSATVDGGTGAARALGWRFLDGSGREVSDGGGQLHRVARLVPPPRPLRAEITALCDVDNPLLGARGAAAVFGPQKGASPGAVERLDEGLAHLARLVDRELGVDVAGRPGAGAAGGLGAAVVAFMGGTLVRGVDRVLDAVEFPSALDGADWVLTGEGRLDASSLDGKVVSGVLARAGTAGVPVAVLAGRVDLPPARIQAAGIAWAGAAAPAHLPDEEAFRGARERVEAGAARFARERLQPPSPRAKATT